MSCVVTFLLGFFQMNNVE